MTPEQQAALEGVVERPLTAAEVAAIELYLAIRNDVAIASILSVGRVALVSRFITTPGVRDLLGPVQGTRFIRVLKELADGQPVWLAPTLSTIGVPVEEHADYAETLGSGYEGIQTKPGIDLGTRTAQAMLDLLAHAPGDHVASVAALKALAEQPNPIAFGAVSEALNKGIAS